MATKEVGRDAKSDTTKGAARKGSFSYYVALLVACTALFGAYCALVHAGGKVLIWGPDSLWQDFNFFVYEGQAIREAFSSLASGTGFVMPSYLFGSGYGSDALVTMLGFLTDPLNLLSALCPTHHANKLFVALIWVRFLLAAVAFSHFAFMKGVSRLGSFVGSLSYVTCGYVLLWGVCRHPQFLNLAILLPFMLAGADDVLAGKLSVKLVVSSALLFFNSIYLSYIAIFLLVAYCLVEYFLVPRERSVRGFLALLGKYVVLLLVAGMIAACAWMPALLSLVSLDRVGISRDVPLLFSLGEYSNTALTMVGAHSTSRGALLGPLPVVCAALFVTNRKKLPAKVWRPTFAMIVLCALALVIPAIGAALNGFSYSSDRWAVALGLVVAYSVALIVPRLLDLSWREWVPSIVICIALLLAAAPYAFYMVAPWGRYLLAIYVAVVILMPAVCLLLSAVRDRSVQFQRLGAKVIGMLACLAILACSFSTFALMGSRSIGGEYFRSLLSVEGSAAAFDEGNLAYHLHALPGTGTGDAVSAGDENPSRVSKADSYYMRNMGVVQDMLFCDFFASYYDQGVDTFRQELALSDHSSNYIYIGHDSRLALEALLGTRYYVASEADDWRAPDTFEPVEGMETVTVSSHDYHCYESDCALPLAFAYPTAILRDDYLSLTPVERQEALLEGCVVDEVPAGLEQVSPTSSAQEIEFEVTYDDGVEQTDDGFVTLHEGDGFTLTTSGVEGAETYVVINGLDFADIDTGSPDDTLDRLMWHPSGNTVVELESDGHVRRLTVTNSINSSYGNRHDFVFYMGGANDGAMTSCHVGFSQTAAYQIDSVQVICQPVEPIEEHVQALQEHALEDVTLGIDEVTAGMESDQDVEYAFFSLPYSDGWEATVDGEGVDIVRADTAFMAVPVHGVGHHDIVLRYSTPGSKAGTLLTVLGFAAFVILIIYRRMRTKEAA